MTSALLLGALVGLRHATDPDHLAAVSTFVAREPGTKRATQLGAAWSLGHGSMLLLVGGAAVLMATRIPPAFSHLAEFAVALLLVGLGVSNLRHAFGKSHDIRQPRHALLRSGAVGIAHGLAGSGLVAVAAAAVMPNPGAALLYLIAFAVGTSAGMVTVSALLCVPLRRLAHTRRLHQALHASTGTLALAVGLWLALPAVLALAH